MFFVTTQLLIAILSIFAGMVIEAKTHLLEIKCKDLLNK